MPNKMIFFDVDGTLLNPITHQVDASSIETLKQLKAKGIGCGLATGRALESVRGLGLLDEIKWDVMVVNNGQKVFNQDEEVIFEQAIEPELLLKIKALADEKGIAILGQGDDWHLWSPVNEHVKKVHQHLGDLPIPEAYDPNKPIYTLMLYGEDISILNDFPELRPVYVDGYYDVLLNGFDKAVAIEKALKKLNLTDYVAMGDSLNDYEMALHAQTFIATHQAVEGLKAVSDYVIPQPHDELQQAVAWLGWLDETQGDCQ